MYFKQLKSSMYKDVNRPASRSSNHLIQVDSWVMQTTSATPTTLTHQDARNTGNRTGFFFKFFFLPLLKFFLLFELLVKLPCFFTIIVYQHLLIFLRRGVFTFGIIFLLRQFPSILNSPFENITLSSFFNTHLSLFSSMISSRPTFEALSFVRTSAGMSSSCNQ